MEITEFKGEYRWLSNFYPAPFFIDDRKWYSVEHFYQAMKSRDYDEQEHIRALPLASHAKEEGRKLQLRENWDVIKLSVMRVGVAGKFTQNLTLGDKLIDTYPAVLVEGNWWGDTYWGVCRGEGKNWLGFILMELRSYLRDTKET